MNNDTLYSEISKLVDIPYLKEATKDEVDKVVIEVRGLLYSRKRSMILPCVLSIRDQSLGFLYCRSWVPIDVHLN
jgi:hypothetical protein